MTANGAISRREFIRLVAASSAAIGIPAWAAVIPEPDIVPRGKSCIDGYYVGWLLIVAQGAGAGQARRITRYDGSTRVATIDPAWVTAPGKDSVFVLVPSQL